MKKMCAIITILTCFAACSKKDPIGKWDDNIHLSKKTATFQPLADSITITTGGDSWWINGIFMDTVMVSNPSNINTSQKNFVFTNTDFVLQRINGTIIKIKMNANTTMVDRKLIIGLQDGDYFDGIVITQQH